MPIGRVWWDNYTQYCCILIRAYAIFYLNFTVIRLVNNYCQQQPRRLNWDFNDYRKSKYACCCIYTKLLFTNSLKIRLRWKKIQSNTIIYNNMCSNFTLLSEAAFNRTLSVYPSANNILTRCELRRYRFNHCMQRRILYCSPVAAADLTDGLLGHAHLPPSDQSSHCHAACWSNCCHLVSR